eukprot:scaffold194206_cov21-Tisochrysis_lutea.AAC.4
MLILKAGLLKAAVLEYRQRKQEKPVPWHPMSFQIPARHRNLNSTTLFSNGCLKFATPGAWNSNPSWDEHLNKGEEGSLKGAQERPQVCMCGVSRVHACGLK